MVAEQLSLSDFQEISISSLPTNLNNCEKKILNGKYCLQVSCVDIIIYKNNYQEFFIFDIFYIIILNEGEYYS